MKLRDLGGKATERGCYSIELDLLDGRFCVRDRRVNVDHVVRAENSK